MTGDPGHLQPNTSLTQLPSTSQQPMVPNPRHAQKFPASHKSKTGDSAQHKTTDRKDLLDYARRRQEFAAQLEPAPLESKVSRRAEAVSQTPSEQSSSPLKRAPPGLSNPSTDSKRRQSSKEVTRGEVDPGGLDEDRLHRAASLQSSQHESHHSNGFLPQRTNPTTAKMLMACSSASKTAAYNGCVLQPVSSHKTPALMSSERLAADGQAAPALSAPVKQPNGRASQVKVNTSNTAKVKVVMARDMPHNRLSFGEELQEEEAQPSSSYSLAHSTADRFRNERELLLPSMASPFQTEGLSGPNNQKRLGPLSFGVVQARGPRPYMEDRHTIISAFTPLNFASAPLPDGVERSFAAIYDGHNGSKAAEYACSRLHMVLAQEPAMRTCTGETTGAGAAWARMGLAPRESQESTDMGRAISHTFQQVDLEILDRARAEQGRDGSTALILLRTGEVVWTAHAGDSRAVLSRGGKAVRLTQDHKPELVTEKARVEANGGRVDFQRCWRVICPARNGRPASGLAVSRSFGDLDFKEPARFIECEPDVTRVRLTPEDSFVVMASDGLWDVMSDQEAVTTAQDALDSTDSRGHDSKATMDARAKSAAEALLQAAQKQGSMDNVTVIILLFHWR